MRALIALLICLPALALAEPAAKDAPLKMAQRRAILAPEPAPMPEVVPAAKALAALQAMQAAIDAAKVQLGVPSTVQISPEFWTTPGGKAVIIIGAVLSAGIAATTVGLQVWQATK